MLSLHSIATHSFSAGRTATVTIRRGTMPRMEAQIEDVAELEAQLKILQLKARLAEMQAQQAAPAVSPPPAPAELLTSPPPLPQPAEVLTSPPPLPPLVPMPAPPIVAQPIPLPEAELNCADFNGNLRPCPTELVEMDDLLGDMKPFSLPDSPLEAALPLLGLIVALVLGYRGASNFAESLRPMDAATARRKREERERLGITEEEEEQSNQEAQSGLVAAVLIIGFELVLFNLRGVWGGS